jgi:hypothetical protein
MAIIDWKARIAASEKARKDAEESLTPADKDEISFRETEAKNKAAAQDILDAKRDMDVARRLEAAIERRGVNDVRSVIIKGSTHSFIVKANPGAHSKWEEKIAEAATNKKLRKQEINAEYAVQSVEDWNGVTGFDKDGSLGYDLIKFFEKNGGMVTPVLNAAALLNGFFAEEAKS